MAVSMHPTTILFILLLLLVCSSCYSDGEQPISLLQTRHSDSILNNQILRKYKAIISFGDSYTDTGNLLYSQKDNPTIAAAKLPFGETFFGHPTGRFSDGRLVIDFVAQALGMPLVPPYLAHKNEDFKHGVNFAVAGGTALDAAFFEKKHIPIPTNYSLGVQLDWFKQLLTSRSTSSYHKTLRNSLFLVGEIGLNDIVHSFSANKSLSEVQSFVPEVIKTITFVIKSVIHEGAITMVVPGNVPIGCFPMYLTRFHSSNIDDYDPSTGCLKRLNKLAQFQNELLQKELNELRRTHPHVNIIYADYYSAVMEMYRFPDRFGFKEGAPKACCGGGGPYNYNETATCGEKGSTTCQDPSIRNRDDYDPSTGCLKRLNKLAQFQNELLQKELNKLRRTHPHVNIIYGDYYSAVMEMYRFPDKFGFKEGAPKACCGGGGQYNFNETATCGEKGSTTCQDPSMYVSWDGIHLTEAAYKWIAHKVLHLIMSQSDNY